MVGGWLADKEGSAGKSDHALFPAPPGKGMVGPDIEGSAGKNKESSAFSASAR